LVTNFADISVAYYVDEETEFAGAYACVTVKGRNFSEEQDQYIESIEFQNVQGFSRTKMKLTDGSREKVVLKHAGLTRGEGKGSWEEIG